ncbi:MAG TPA: ATP-binding protein [Candidatus Binatia bacterium]|nr:ATP-binding protein [Candidatus Binatia bacterium]
MTPPASTNGDPYRDEMVRRVAQRAPLGFAVFLTCLGISTFFEIVHFPERRLLMSGFAAGFLAIVAVAWIVIRRRPQWSIFVLVATVNLIGAGINVYHALAGASVAMCIWVLTGLIASSAVILPWGRRSQALACLGTLVVYPIHLQSGVADPLTWAAGGTYLLAVASLAVFGAGLFAHYVRSDLQLTATLSEREARLQSYFDLSLVGTAIVDAAGRCGEVNAELCATFGYTAPELLGRPWSDLVHPDERAVATALLAQGLAGAPDRLDLQCMRRDGTAIYATVAVRGLPGARGTIDHALILLHDITERRRAELERERSLTMTDAARRHAEEASRAKDAFLATVSHELRAPLTPILAWADMLHDGALGGEQTVTALRAIKRNARAQARLIDDLLDVSRIVSGEWRVALRPVAVAPVVSAALEVVRPVADAKGVALVSELPADPVMVRADPERLQQVVWNLVSNGVKFTPRGGRVVVTLAESGQAARITVHDTGEGISPEFVPYVFEPFRQADGSSTRRHGGLGLGLAIVRALVERHGGTVRADSAGEGHGATFTVELPLLDANGIVAAEPAGEVDDARTTPRAVLRGLHVLVVDDDPDSNAVVSALLSARGAEVRTAQSAGEALSIAVTWRPDVVVSDVAMPGEDGLALLRELRARRETIGDVPAIALTAHGSKSDRRRLLDAGFQAHVAKPFDPVHLAAVVETTAHAAHPAG